MEADKILSYNELRNKKCYKLVWRIFVEYPPVLFYIYILSNSDENEKQGVLFPYYQSLLLLFHRPFPNSLLKCFFHTYFNIASVYIDFQSHYKYNYSVGWYDKQTSTVKRRTVRNTVSAPVPAISYENTERAYT